LTDTINSSMSTMADKSVLTLKASHNENALLSKESTIINNNLMSFRTFGRDISNIGTNEPNKPSSVYMVFIF